MNCDSCGVALVANNVLAMTVTLVVWFTATPIIVWIATLISGGDIDTLVFVGLDSLAGVGIVYAVLRSNLLNIRIDRTQEGKNGTDLKEERGQGKVRH